MAESYLAELDASPEDLFFHIVAILHTPAFRADNQGALRQDWPRIPLPEAAALVKASAELGEKIAALLDVDRKIKGINEAPIRSELQALAVIERFDKGR